MTERDPKDFLGKEVECSNPHIADVWRGKAIAYIDRPSLLLEQADGKRLVLPFEWAILAEGAARD